MRSRKVQVWVYAKKSDQVLLLKVIPKRGDGWQPITGGVDEGESYSDGAKRELQEETQIDPEIGTWKDLNYEFSFESRFGPATERAYLYIIEKAVQIQIDPHEHTDAKWVAILDAIGKVPFDNQKQALTKVVDVVHED